jgi:hypothetical protein
LETGAASGTSQKSVGLSEDCAGRALRPNFRQYSADINRGEPWMIETSCHCGRIKLRVPEAPETVIDCNCSICRRYGVLWAYYSPKLVRIASGADGTDVYMWNDCSIEFHRCRNCGCVSHWSPVDRTYDRMGVNARLMPPEILAQTRVRRLDGANTEQYLDAST